MIAQCRTRSFFGPALATLLTLLAGGMTMTGAAQGGTKIAPMAAWTSADENKVFPSAEQVEKITLGKSTMNEAIAVFGEPQAYVWDDQTLPKNMLPQFFCMVYPRQFQVVVSRGVVTELRHNEPGFVFRGKLQVGSDEEEAFKLLGPPTGVVSGKIRFGEGVLYKNIPGRNGNVYYSRSDQGVRIFFWNGKVRAIYQTPVRRMWPAAAANSGKTGERQGQGERPSRTKYVKEKFDRPFVNDPELAGAWKSVDFVPQIEDYWPGSQQWYGDLYLTGLTFLENGKTSGPWAWTKGYLWHPGDQAEGPYLIKAINGEHYLFMAWISGDVTLRGREPWYYVMKKTGAGETGRQSGAAGNPSTGAPSRQTVEDLGAQARALANEAGGLAQEQARLESARKELEREKAGLEATRKALEAIRPRDEVAQAMPGALEASGGVVKIVETEVAGDLPVVAWKTRFEELKNELERKKSRYGFGIAAVGELQHAVAELGDIPPEAGATYQAAARLRLEVAQDLLTLMQKRAAAALDPTIELKKAECEVKIAQAVCAGDRPAAARAELEKAQAILQNARARAEAGVFPKDEMIRAEAAVKIAQARCDGDAPAEAKARVDEAEALLKVVKIWFESGVSTREELERAQQAVEASQTALARVKVAEQPKP